MVLDLATAQQAATASLNLSVAVITGASMSTAWLLAAPSQWAVRRLRRLRTVTRAGAAAAIVAAIAVLWLEAAAMAEVPVASAASAVWSVLTATHYGVAWLIGIVAMAVVAATTAIPSRPGRRSAAVALRLVAIGVFLYSRCIVSHAGAGGDVSWAVAADWLHIVLISLWVGEVLVAGFITLGDSADCIRQDRLDRAQYVEALSTSATIALSGIVVTGLFSAWRGLGSLDNVTGNPYASVLLVKVSLVAAAAVLGGANRLLVMQRLIAQLRNTAPSGFASERRFTLILQIEAVVLFAALILAAILSSTSPPTAG